MERVTCLMLGLFALGSALAEEDAREDVHVIEVIGTTTLGTSGIDVDRYAGNAQYIGSKEIDNSNGLNVTDIFISRSSSVTVNASQNNPYQDDIFYRGQQASPIVGSAIGLSVYMDGVRINESFGDTLNWDLIPHSALSVVNVIPGSNPVYGLNTLGGALALRTKSGNDFQGTELSASGGWFARRNFELQHGGNRNGFDWYINTNYVKEDGWRTRSPSEVIRNFLKVGWENDVTDIDLSYIYADNDLTGNGFAPERLLDLDREAAHTYPDQTLNTLHHFNLQGLHRLSALWQVSGNAFYRNYERNTLNGDAEIACQGESRPGLTLVRDNNSVDRPLAPNLCSGTVAQILAADNGITGLFEAGDGDPLPAAILLDRVELAAEGEQRMTFTDSENYGSTLQTTLFHDLFNRNNQFSFGIDISQNSTTFRQSSAEAVLVRNGNSVATMNAEAQETEVWVRTTQENLGFFFTDTIQTHEKVDVTLGGRWQTARVKIRDLTGEAENEDLNGTHRFSRFNPSGGIAFKVMPNMTLFGNYSEGFRIPTAAELSCADEDDPCNLPNAFVADPPLDPVVARTYEIGARGALPYGDSLRWNMALYRTDLKDDLLFIVTETGGGGFFQNIDKTRRQGIELGLNGAWDRFSYFLNYSYIKATFEDNITLASVINAAGQAVRSGNSIPGIPEHTLKFGLGYEVFKNFFVGSDVFVSSGSYLRGDESNSLPRTDAYATWDLNARYVYKQFEFWARVENVLNAKYQTAGIVNFNASANLIFNDAIGVERFAAPGQPIAAFFGVKYSF